MYYLKDKKAMIYKCVPVENNGFMPSSVYYPIATAPIWCYAKQLSQMAVYSAMAATMDETRMFVFNFHRNVKVNDLVFYRDTWYTITRVDTTDDYNGEMFVYVKDTPAGGKPSDDEVKEYNAEIWQ